MFLDCNCDIIIIVKKAKDKIMTKNSYIVIRLHHQKDAERVRECISFMKGYFEMWNKKIELTFREFIIETPTSPEDKIYDLLIITSQSENSKLVSTAHAVAWTWLKTTK